MSKVTLSNKQREFWREANHRWNFKVGATRSGKTYMDYFLIMRRILERLDEPGLAVILGNTRETIRRNIIIPMQEIYGTQRVSNIKSDNSCIMFGEKVFCLGADNINHVDRIRGASIKYCYGDEVATWHQEVFDMLKSRLDKPCSVFDGALNPQGPNHWLKAFLDRNADIYTQHYTIFDNPFLPKEFVESLCKEYEGTVYYNRYILGEWALAEGLIYRDFANNHSKYVIEDAQKWLEKRETTIMTLMVGVDYGGTGSATKFQATGITRDWAVLALDEEYIDHKKESVDPNDLNRRYAQFVERVSKSWGMSQTRADSAEQILIRGLMNTAAQKRLKTQVKNALKMQITDRIRLTILLMGQGRFYVTKKCAHLIDALSTAVYDATKNEDTRLDDGTTDIDSLDAFEYTIEPYYRQLEAAGHRGN